MSEFDPQRARTKRPLPMWVDAFLRDTMHLDPLEIGAYHLILYAMWSRPSCDFPDDDRKLATVCRVSLHRWRTKLAPTIKPFFETLDGCLVSRRLQKESKKVENFSTKNSLRKSGKKHSKPLNLLDHGKTADASAGIPADNPSNYPRSQDKGGGGGAREDDQDFRVQLLEAMGLDWSGLTGHGSKMIGTTVDMVEAERWQTDLDLDEASILRVVKEVIATKHDGPPKGFKYFRPAMQRLSGAMRENKLQSIRGQRGNLNARPTSQQITDAALALAANLR